MIQQYGPMVKNLPMMWKLYKGFKDLPSEEKSDKNKTETPRMAEETVPKSEPVKRTKKEKDNDSENVEVKKRPTGTSMPKLYI